MTPVNPNALVHIEFPSSNLKRSLKFYETVFGWKPTPSEIHNYCILDVPEDCAYGLALVGGNKEVPGERPGPVHYFKVPSADDILERLKLSEGKLIFGPKKVPPIGYIYQLQDPDGNRIGLYLDA